MGRDNADLLISADLSISRQHAKIQCLATCIKVVDIDSKYGVFINDGIATNTMIEKKKAVRLECGDTIRFGRMQTTFRVEKIDVKVCTSTIDDDTVKNLKELLHLVGGKLEATWNINCTHLVMPTITVTVKVLQTLAHGIPIVNPAYFVKYIQNAQTNQNVLPDVNDYVPEINEPYLIKEPTMMHVHLDRQRLFQNKTFIFMVKRHMVNFKQIVELAGGKCMNLQEHRIKRKDLLKTEHIPIQYSSTGATQCSADVGATADYITANGRRLVGDTEIGLALIHRSIERFCNPDHNIPSVFEIGSGPASILQANTIAEATPIIVLDSEPEVSEVYVAESIEPTNTEESNNNDKYSVKDSQQPSTSTDDIELVATTANTRSTRSGAAKRKHGENVLNDCNKKSPDKGSTAPSKKRKSNEQDSASSSGAMSQKSGRIERISGFINTQNRFKNVNRNEQKSQSMQESQLMQKENDIERRKRLVSMLNSDDDESNDENGGNLFCFSKPKAKRSKPTVNEVKKSAISLDSDDEDDGGNMFNFANAKRSKKKKNTGNSANIDENDAATSDNTQHSFKKPYQHILNRSSFIPLEIPAAEKISTVWITMKAGTLNLNNNSAATEMPAIKIKEENLEEWEMTDAEKKRRFVNSIRNAFEMRSIDLGQSKINRHSTIDEPDNMSINPGDSTLNRTKNFKSFVKVRDFCVFYCNLQQTC